MNNGPEDTKFERTPGLDARPDSAEHPAAQGPFAGSDAQVATDADDLQLESALRVALRHTDAPAGFADRLMQAALAGSEPSVNPPVQPAAPSAAKASGNKGRVLHWPQSRLWITGAVAAGLAAGVVEGGLAYHRVREQQRRIMEATQQFQTTERITVHAIAQAREQLQKAGVPLNLD